MPHREKTVVRGVQPGLTQTGLYNHRRWLEASNFGFRKRRDCTIYVEKTKALISCAVTAQLICVFVFAYAKSWFSHDVAHILDTLCRFFSAVKNIIEMIYFFIVYIYLCVLLCVFVDFLSIYG